MSIIKSILNNTISMMVTRNRVIKATGCPIEDFTRTVNRIIIAQSYNSHEYLMRMMYDYDGVDCFIKDFRKEGWCKTELRSILGTLFHLNREINDYAEYWF